MATESFVGVYSTQTPTKKRGRDVPEKRYWFVWQRGDGTYWVQALGAAFQPQGEPLAIDINTFEVSFFAENTILARPERCPVFSEDADAPAEPDEADQAGAVAAIERELRARFAALLLRLRRDEDRPDVLRELEELAQSEEGIVPEHKYMFTDFGIDLRKGKLPESALAHARRVLVLAPDDVHAHFNIARVYYSLDRLAEAEQHLLTALAFLPSFEYARAFLEFIVKERRQKSVNTRAERRPLA